MRTFIAIELPDNVKGHLIGIEQQIGNNMAKIKWVIKENLHLTLRFLGEVGEETIEQIEERLSTITLEPFDLSLSNLGVFPNPNYIKVLWVGVDPADKVVQLYNKIEEALAPFKLKKDHKYHPHITLGRVAFVKDKTALKESLNIKVEKLKFGVDGFKLKKSTLTPKGPVYEDIMVYPLQ